MVSPANDADMRRRGVSLILISDFLRVSFRLRGAGYFRVRKLLCSISYFYFNDVNLNRYGRYKQIHYNRS